MKTDVASTFPPLVAHPPPEGAPGFPHVAAPIIPIAPARPPLADEVIAAAQMQDFDLARDLTLFARVLRRAEGGRRVMVIFVVSIAVTIANMFGQVRLNEWNGQFFGRCRPQGFVRIRP